MTGTRSLGGNRRALIGLGVAAAMLVSTEGAALAQGPVQLVDDDRQQCSGATHTTIQSAVAAAPAGGRIEVCPGRYQGPVEIRKSLDFQAVSAPGVPHHPAATADRASCLDVGADDPRTDAIVENAQPFLNAFSIGASEVRIAGFVARETTKSIGRAAIGFLNGSAVGSGYRIERNVLEGSDAGFGQRSNGTLPTTISGNCFRGNRLGLEASQPYRNVRIVGNFFNDQTDTGIRLQGNPDGVEEVTIEGNDSTDDRTFVNLRATRDISIVGNRISGADIGVQVSYLAGATIPAGIAIVRNEIIDSTFDGIEVGNAPAGTESLIESRIAENSVRSSGRDGIRLGPGAVGTVVEQNVVRESGEHDCHDESTGSGTAGTANVWRDNEATSENRLGLCLPDADFDGVANEADNCPSAANTDQADMDGDGVGDVCDDDRDGDGAANSTDNCADVPNPGQENQDRDGSGDVCDSDRDGDGVENGTDNCADTSNADQANQDGDAFGDACDSDRDGDGVADASDNCPLVDNASQSDLDGDAVGDACDTDRDGDGVANGGDNCPDASNTDQADWDRDGQGDACDADRPVAQQITDLSQTIGELPIHKGTQRSLQAKLEAALEAYNAGDLATACGSLASFIHEVRAQSGKKIPAPDAAELIATAEEIRTAIGC